MDVIALTGISNSGKTETLNILYQIILLNGYVQVPGHFRDLGNGDCLDVFEKNGVRVGIVTQGDYVIGAHSVINHLHVLDVAGCVKCICACTTSKPKILIAIRMAYTAPPPLLVPKTPSPVVSSNRIVNGADANHLYTLI
jgi:hypothetical protein